jgi:hypothetical protein
MATPRVLLAPALQCHLAIIQSEPRTHSSDSGPELRPCGRHYALRPLRDGDPAAGRGRHFFGPNPNGAAGEPVLPFGFCFCFALLLR